MGSQFLFTANTNYIFRHAQGRENRLLTSPTPRPSNRMSVRMYQLSSNGHIFPPVLAKDS